MSNRLKEIGKYYFGVDLSDPKHRKGLQKLKEALCKEELQRLHKHWQLVGPEKTYQVLKHRLDELPKEEE